MELYTLLVLLLSSIVSCHHVMDMCETGDKSLMDLEVVTLPG